MVTQHTAVPYQSEDPTDHKWTVLAHTSTMNGDSVARVERVGGVRRATFTGACPCCHKTFSWSGSLEAVTGVGGVLGDDDSTDDTYLQVQVGCGCGVRHSGSPRGVTGCGVVFKVHAKDLA